MCEREREERERERERERCHSVLPNHSLQSHLFFPFPSRTEHLSVRGHRVNLFALIFRGENAARREEISVPISLL